MRSREERFIYWMNKINWLRSYHRYIAKIKNELEQEWAEWWLKDKRYYQIIWDDEWLKRRWGEAEEPYDPDNLPYHLDNLPPVYKVRKVEMAKLETEEELFDMVFPETNERQKADTRKEMG